MVLKTLITDDSRLARTFLKKALCDIEEIEILEAVNGKEALELCREHQFDFIFLDLTMPEMDGYQFLEALKAENLKFFIIVVSADIQPKAKERVIELGAKTFIDKPIDFGKVLDILKSNGFI